MIVLLVLMGAIANRFRWWLASSMWTRFSEEYKGLIDLTGLHINPIGLIISNSFIYTFIVVLHWQNTLASLISIMWLMLLWCSSPPLQVITPEQFEQHQPSQ